jgi:hypothetical protein
LASIGEHKANMLTRTGLIPSGLDAVDEVGAGLFPLFIPTAADLGNCDVLQLCFAEEFVEQLQGTRSPFWCFA